MNRFFLLAVTLLAFSNSVMSKNTCSIFVHGFTANNKDYFGDLPRQVHWDSSQNIEEAADEVALGILDQIDTCSVNDIIVLRPHSYGAAVVMYILGIGRRFQNKYPDHHFVEIYKKTYEVVSYTGAYHGTPLMDLVCSNTSTKIVGGTFGKSCVESLLTNSVKSVTNYVNNPGVPTYLVHSTDRSGYLNSTGTLIARDGVSFTDFYFKGMRNQNDNTLPISSTRACASQEVMLGENQNCKKINSSYFIDYFHEKNRNHTEFLEDKGFMLMGSIGED
jgi:hypothetical protein